MFLSRAAIEVLSNWKPHTDIRFLAKADKDNASMYIYDLIGGSFGGISAKQVAAALSEMKGAKTLTVRVNSPGGDLQEGLTIYNLIRGFKGESKTVVDGLAGSAASVIALAANKVVTSAQALWMIHDPFLNFTGGSVDFRRMADVLDKCAGSIRDLYAKKTGLPAEKLQAMMTAETWMDATEATKLGFSDEISGDEQDKPIAALSTNTEPFTPPSYSFLSKLTNCPAAIKQRGSDQARLASAKALVLRHRAP